MVNEQPVRTSKKIEYWLIAALLPWAIGAVSCLTRVIGLTAGCRTDARMGGVGIANTITSLLCHSYMQGRKQAEERRNAIPEVNLRMKFLQQVVAEAKDMRKGRKATIKAESGEGVEGRADQGCLKKEKTPEVEKDEKSLF